MDDIIEVKGLSKKYASFVAVDGISFSVHRGEIFGILGPNGAGKTTTLEMIEGLRTITTGTVSINGIDVSKNTQEVKKIIGVQLQTTGFFENLTLSELLVTYGSLYNLHIDPLELLKEVELVDKARSQVKTLSGGQKQRFSIAIALANNPLVLFLDEPTTGLDPQARRHLWNLISSINSKGKTVVITTHYMDEAEELCQRVAVMDHGNIIKLNTPEKLIDDLLETGFRRERIEKAANLEDVFLNLTGHDIRDEK